MRFFIDVCLFWNSELVCRCVFVMIFIEWKWDKNCFFWMIFIEWKWSKLHCLEPDFGRRICGTLFLGLVILIMCTHAPAASPNWKNVVPYWDFDQTLFDHHSAVWAANAKTRFFLNAARGAGEDSQFWRGEEAISVRSVQLFYWLLSFLSLIYI